MDDGRYPTQHEGYAIKAVGGALELDVVGLPFGTDKGGHTVTRETDVGLRADESVPVYYHHGYAERGAKAVERIARAIYKGVGNVGGVDGHVFRVILDGAKAIAQSIYESAKQGKARASSDSATHLVRPFGIVGQKGTLSSWPILGLSLMDAATYLTAVNPNAIAIPALKAFVSEAETGEAGGVEIDPQRLLDEIERLEGSVKAEDKMAEETKIEVDREVRERLAKIEKVIDLSGTLDAIAAKAKAQADEQAASAEGKAEAALKAKVDAAVKAAMDAQAVAQNRPGFRGFDAAKADDAAKAAHEKQLFEAFYRTGDTGWAQYMGDAAKATINITTAAQGGYALPRDYASEVIKPLTEGSLFRGRVRAMSNPIVENFQMVSLANSSRAVTIAEQAAYDQKEPTLGEVKWTPIYYSRMSKATKQSLANPRLDVYGQLLAPDAVNAFLLAENEDLTVGNGTTAPQGIVPASTVGETVASASAITADEIKDLYYSLNYLYRNNAVWMLNDTTRALVDKLKDSQGRFLWNDSLRDGEPPTLMGKPVIINNYMDTPAAGKKTIWFGDMSYYMIVDFAGLGFQRLIERFADVGVVGFLWDKWLDGKVLLPNAMRVLAHP